jgi:hypothetical protein
LTAIDHENGPNIVGIAPIGDHARAEANSPDERPRADGAEPAQVAGVTTNGQHAPRRCSTRS